MLLIKFKRNSQMLGSGLNPKIESVSKDEFIYSYHPIYKVNSNKKIKGMIDDERRSFVSPIKHYERFKKLIETHDSLIDKVFDYEFIRKILDEQLQLIVEFDFSLSD